MIKNKRDLLYYLECDRVALKREKLRWFGEWGGGVRCDMIWRYEIVLRWREYYLNCKSKWNPINYFIKFRLSKLGRNLGFSIGPNICGPGLSIAHAGTIIINKNSVIGKNCRIQTGVTLGTTNGSDEAPKLGNNVFLGEGCKIIGAVTIADNVQIGANAVVVKSINIPGTTWGGVPARKISNHSSELNLVDATTIVDKTFT